MFVTDTNDSFAVNYNVFCWYPNTKFFFFFKMEYAILGRDYGKTKKMQFHFSGGSEITDAISK